MILNSTAKCWDVRFTEPQTREIKQVDGTMRAYTSTVNGSVIVVAKSAAIVCGLVAKHYPNATIYQINHRGKGVILAQDEL